MLHARMYSTEPLPREIELPGDPLLFEEARAILIAAGVFYYGDERGRKSVVWGNVKLPTPAYLSNLIWDDEFWIVDEWADADKIRRATEKYGDSKAWLIWNKPVYVIEITEVGLRVQR